MLPNDPPLRAVRAFEAIARLGSISAAAKELMISPSAVSHQLKTLEAFLQMPLTEGRGAIWCCAARAGILPLDPLGV